MSFQNLVRVLEKEWERTRQPGMPTLRQLAEERQRQIELEEEGIDPLEYVLVKVRVGGRTCYVPVFEAAKLAEETYNRWWDAFEAGQVVQEDYRQFVREDYMRRLRRYARRRYP